MSRSMASRISCQLNSYSLALCLVASSLTPCSAQSPGHRFARLPKLRPVREETLQAEKRDTISFAAGAVDLQAPEQWWVQELPRGREVRLVLSPDEVSRRIPADSIWLCYHVLEASELAPEAELRNRLPTRLKLSTTAGTAPVEPVEFRLGPWAAIAQEFVSTQVSNPATGSSVSIRGRHVLVRTDWGIFELHAAAPVEQFETRAAAWAQVWDSIQLEAPRQPSLVETAAVPDARAILGSWKSYRSRVRLRPDGTITIVPDSVNLLTDSGTREAVEGTFEARGDLLFVTWRDGSLLNLRWRSRGTDLFVTDHEGQISQLKRLLE